MYREPIQRRNRFWIWWILFSVVHLLVTVGIVYVIRNGVLDSWFSTPRVNAFAGDVLVYTVFVLNLPLWIAVDQIVRTLVMPTALVLAYAVVVLDSMLYGVAFASVLWLAVRDDEPRPRYLGFTPRVVGRGLLFGMGYVAATWVLGFVMLANSHGLWSSRFVGQDAIDTLLHVMHPLASILGLDFQISGSRAIRYATVMMLDSAMIGVIVVWGWHWFLPQRRAEHGKTRVI